jgi:hypothetical protein
MLGSLPFSAKAGKQIMADATGIALREARTMLL